MNVCIIGTGYVGLVTGTCLASVGHRVTCVDIDQHKIDRLNQGEVPIYEPGLKEMLESTIDTGRITFETDVCGAVRNTDVVFLAVGTPSRPDGLANVEFVLEAARQVGENLQGYAVIVTKSTVPVGTTERVREVVAAATEQQFDVVSNPEFLREGNAVGDCLRPDRVVIGVDSSGPVEIMKKLYAPFVAQDRVVVMDIPSAELSKYAANAMLAARISFMNEMAALSERVGADIESVREAVGLDKRIGDQFLNAGIGYGGSCFPKDVRALKYLALSRGCEVPILSAIEETNEVQKTLLTRKIVEHFGRVSGQAEGVHMGGNGNGVSSRNAPLADKTLAVWGLSFKPGTDDVREAPALTIIGKLLELGANVRAFDPEAMNAARPHLCHSVSLGQDPYEILERADGLLLVTEWEVFLKPDFGRIKKLMRHPAIFDGRNVYDPEVLSRLGFLHFAIGRPRPALDHPAELGARPVGHPQRGGLQAD